MVNDEPLLFRITIEQDGQRLDKALCALSGFGRRHMRALFDAQCVRVDGRHKPPSSAAQAGEQVEILPLPSDEGAATPFELQLVQEHEHWVIVDKPAGQASTPLLGRAGNSVAELLLERYPAMQGIGYRPSEAGLLHRLDTQTSGLLLAARTQDAFRRLRQALQRGQIVKRYYAVVHSDPSFTRRTIDLPLKPHPKNRRKVLVRPATDLRSKAARTELSVVRLGPVWMLLDVAVDHAYRHQIRAHLGHIGFPLAGDVLYGATPLAELPNRHALHAHTISWPGDEQLASFTAHSPLPPDLETLISKP